jgi:hypothetical protein
MGSVDPSPWGQSGSASGATHPYPHKMGLTLLRHLSRYRPTPALVLSPAPAGSRYALAALAEPLEKITPRRPTCL